MKNQFYFIVAASLFSCSQNKLSVPDDEQAQTINDARQALYNYYADIQAEGFLAEFKYLDSSENFFWVAPGYSSPLSYDSVAAIVRRNAVLFTSVTIRWEALTVIPIATDHVSYRGKSHSLLKDTAGNAYESRLIESGVMIKRKDGWKLLCGQTSLLPQ